MRPETIERYGPLVQPFLDRRMSEGSSEKTVEFYGYCVHKMLEYLDKKHGAITLKNLTFDMLDDYRLYLRKQKCTSRTIHNYVMAIRQWLNYHDLTTLYKSFIAPKKSIKGDVDYLTLKEVWKLIKAVDKEPIGEMVKRRKRMTIAFLFSTGMRITEAANTLMEDIDHEKMMIRVRAGVTKTRRGRHVPLSHTLLKYIREYKELRPESKYLFDKNATEHMSTNTIYQNIKDTAESVNMRTRVHPHLFRVSFITALDNGNRGIGEIMDISGHMHPNSIQPYLGKKRRAIREVSEHHPLDGGVG